MDQTLVPLPKLMVFVYAEYKIPLSSVHGHDNIEQHLDVFMFKSTYVRYGRSLMALCRDQFWVWSSLRVKRLERHVYDVKALTCGNTSHLKRKKRKT